jgi:NAD(P)-dependent dehydrogenase (short-subunit alcohol dehydrogenase family)
MKTWFITGISRGLGFALAQAALSRGDMVVGTVRNQAPEFDKAEARLHVIPLDMGDGPAVDAATVQAFDLAGGKLDVIVNNAGYGLLGAIEDAADAEVERLFAVDVFGPFRLIRAALPRLRAQGSGHIINITSIAGRAPGAGSGLYAAAKHALEGLSASLAQELAGTGVNVTAVAPGAFRTDFLSAHSIRRSPAAARGYEATVGRVGQAFDAMAGKQLGDPVRAAEALLKLADDAHPPTQLLLGSDALRRAREKLRKVTEEIDRSEVLTCSTDFKS